MERNMRAWCLKSCPTCGGDLYVERFGSKDPKCLQCGRFAYQRSPEEVRALREEVETGRKVRLP